MDCKPECHLKHYADVDWYTECDAQRHADRFADIASDHYTIARFDRGFSK